MTEIKDIVAVFPGQGSQRQGMGKDFYDQMSVCRQTYEEASDAVGLDVASICFNEDDRLNLTEYTQPCIVTTEVAMIRGLAERYGFQAGYFGGHSLGEFTALVAAGVIPFGDAVQIVRMRGKLMQDAVPVGVGSMAAVISEDIDVAALKKMIEDLPVDVANINSANQVVISGDTAALPEVENRCKNLFVAPKTFRFVKLNVSAPFHSRFMKKIEQPFTETLKNFSKSFDISTASRVTSNYAGFFHASSVDTVINNLVSQLSNSVLWRENMQVLARHASRIYEIGPGRPLRDFFRTIDVTCDSIISLVAAEKIFARAS
ncbi:MAG: ACP S-malonyltransferase [Deltaproteobacteria bacterium HGW-Deltaproteobacteria-1]|jgi:[acyl-carrier-protein] S-malonyltransferase/trans-AT polyketide synthase/acyltransferase/oxidoreductase domain-containing protein|nr:MAG: ACP S-malonyltransferase [Deltaproteobacteria bacterium HGW-Deltaproteobacteria-1]